MIKIFNKTADYETYSANGINSGELCYVKEDKSAHFRTNNIDGSDKTYNMSEGEGGSANLTTLEVTENGTYNTTGTDYDGYSEVTVNVAAPELTWEQATPNASYYNAKMVDGLEIGKTYRIHITYTWQEGMYIGRPFFWFVCSNNNTWDTYSAITGYSGLAQIQIDTDSEDFYFDITFPKFKDAAGGDDYGIAIEQGGGAYPEASMEIALLD